MIIAFILRYEYKFSLEILTIETLYTIWGMKIIQQLLVS